MIIILNVRLKSLRKSFKKTQLEISEFLGITRPAYTAYEQGNRTPDNETVQKLADYYDVSLDYLYGRSDIMKPLSKGEKDIAKRIELFKEELEQSDGLAFDGEPMSDEAKESLIESMELLFRQTQRLNKKFAPKKYREEE